MGTATTALDRDAEQAALELGDHSEVRAVCVIGSSARGDSTAESDIDLLAIVGDRDAAASVRSAYGRRRHGRRVQLKLLSEEGLTTLFQARSTFAVHVLRECVVVSDPHERFAALRAPHSLHAPVRDNSAELSLRLEPYEDLGWCQGLYLYCLADFYSAGRAAAYTIMGRSSQFEFSGAAALRAVAEHRPELAGVAQVVDALRPFYVLVERDEHGKLPFGYRDCHTEAHQARDAARALVQAIR